MIDLAFLLLYERAVPLPDAVSHELSEGVINVQGGLFQSGYQLSSISSSLVLQALSLLFACCLYAGQLQQERLMGVLKGLADLPD